MKLSDVMSAAGLASYAEVALVLFMLAFVAVALRLFLRRNSEDWAALEHMPLGEERKPFIGGTKP